MPRFEDDFQVSPNDMLENMFAETVTYRPKGNSDNDVDILARWRPDQIITNLDYDGDQTILTGLMTCNPADVTSPSKDDQFVINSEVWQVDTIGRRTPLLDLQLKNFDQESVGPGESSRIIR